jgi:hypothetical protein
MDFFNFGPKKSAPLAHKKWTSLISVPKKCAIGAQKMDFFNFGPKKSAPLAHKKWTSLTSVPKKCAIAHKKWTSLISVPKKCAIAHKSNFYPKCAQLRTKNGLLLLRILTNHPLPK